MTLNQQRAPLPRSGFVHGALSRLQFALFEWRLSGV